MKRSVLTSTIGLSLLLLSACTNSSSTTAQDSVEKSIKVCQYRDPDTGSCADNNGDDINNPRATGYDFTIHHSEWGLWNYRLTGFYPQAGGWKVRGWRVDPDVTSLDPNVSADGDVLGLMLGGTLYVVKDMKVDLTSLSVRFCDAGGGSCERLSVDQMFSMGALLVLALPNPSGRGSINFNWTFGSGARPVEKIKAWGADVSGQLVLTAAKGQIPTSLCKSRGAEENVVFQQGYYWDPDTFHKYTDPLAITVTCEEGAIAEGLARGYTPWSTAMVFDGSVANMTDWQQSFIRMKTADYCGTGLTHTVHGTSYYISAPLDKLRDQDPIAKLEAIWGPDGAFCVNQTAPRDNRRHPEIAMGCPAVIPDCDDVTVKMRRPSNLVDGIP